MANIRKQLQKECSRAIGYYTRIMQEECGLLGEVKDALIPDDQLEKIFAHREQELLAYAAYTRAQRRLWTFLSYSNPRLVRLPDVLPADEKFKKAE